MLKQRLLIGIIGGAVAVAVLLSDNIWLSICIAVITLIALYEMYHALGYFKQNIPLAVFGFLVAVTVIFVNIMWYSAPQAPLIGGLMALLFGYLLVLFCYMVLTHNRTRFQDVATSFFVTMYITLFLAHIILIRRAQDGALLVWLVFLISWMTDTGAYTVGRLCGKHKLLPSVSPKKTVEGAIGGIVTCVVVLLLYGLLCQEVFSRTVNYLPLIGLGVLGSVFAQFGDLLASCIKREHGIKDFGAILPGHGGVLDRFDSVILVAPFVFYFIRQFPVLG